MSSIKFSGIIPPMVTVFNENEELDLEKIKDEVKFLSSFEIDGLSVTGSTGEGALLSNEEIKIITETVKNELKRLKKDIPLITGIIRNSTREAIKAAQLAKTAGADGLLITPTFYHTASSKGNFEYYKAITETVELPTIVYNVVPTNQISPDLMFEIGELEAIVGVKQIDAEKLAAMVDKCGDKIKVFSACDDMLYSTYVAGADGAIAAIITAVPELTVLQWKAFKKGDMKKAIEISKNLYQVYNSYFDEKPFVGKIKEVINQLGRPVGKARRPVQEPDKARKEFINTKLKQVDLVE